MKTYMERLKELREDNDINQKEIASILQTSQQMYSRYESGKNEIPIHHLITLANFYKVSTDYILGLSNNVKWIDDKEEKNINFLIKKLDKKEMSIVCRLLETYLESK